MLVVATCGLIYELLAGTIASYLLGDSVTQFSTVIGTYLFAMGVGSFLSRYVREDEIGVFVRVEVLIALIGGWSAAGLFLLFPLIDDFRLLLYGLVLTIGTLVGLEIPLLIRILKRRFALRELVSNVLTYDYVGALIASLLFPLVLVPWLGMIRTGLVFGLANVAVAIALLLMLRGAAADRPGSRRGARGCRQPGRRARLCRAAAALVGSRGLRRAGDLCEVDTVPAHRPHPPRRRPAALSQRQPAVLDPRRVPLPRGAGAGRRWGGSPIRAAC